MRFTQLGALIFSSLFLLAACGQKGALYLTEDQQAALEAQNAVLTSEVSTEEVSAEMVEQEKPEKEDE